MFASFKRSPVSTPTPGNATTTGTEKDSSADYVDLEKRADGRWSVQNRSGTLKVAIGTAHTDTAGKATNRSREACSGFLPAQVGVLLFIVFILIISGVFIGTTGMYVARDGGPLVLLGWQWADGYSAGRSMRHVDFLVAVTSLSLWAFLFVTCMLGLVRTRCCLPPQPLAGK